MSGVLRVAAPSGATIDRTPRCRQCGKLLARYLTRPWRIDCPRCKTMNRLPNNEEPDDEHS